MRTILSKLGRHRVAAVAESRGELKVELSARHACRRTGEGELLVLEPNVRLQLESGTHRIEHGERPRGGAVRPRHRR